MEQTGAILTTEPLLARQHTRHKILLAHNNKNKLNYDMICNDLK